jgi:xanthine dehydrogenase iron-sulfur cluster and FAD-binding subunit A
MRLYALFRNKPEATEEEIKVALSENLCRCTGYEAIWEAALLAQELMKGTRVI